MMGREEQDNTAIKMLEDIRKEIAAERPEMKYENSKRIVDENIAILDNLISRAKQRTAAAPDFTHPKLLFINDLNKEARKELTEIRKVKDERPA